MAGPTAWLRKSIIDGVDPFIVATDFGSRGDGTTDDTVALQAAIEAAYGKLLYIPKGEYILSQNASTGYCLRIMDSVSILMEPGAVLNLATSVPNTVNAIQIGDGTTAVSGVTIEGGVIDGDAVANGGAYSVANAAIYASGPVSRVTIRGMSIRNCLAAGLVVSGESSESRAKHITVEDCEITEVAEGVRFEKCDEFHMRGGSITKMMSQDCFEPHGANSGWSLRDCYIAEPHSSNSAVEIFPQWGNIEGGVIDNCTIVSDEIRVSLSSGATIESFEVRDVTIRGNYLKNSNIYAGVGGKFTSLKIDGNTFEGPCNVPRGTSSPFAGIRCHGTNNSSIITNNRIYGYQGSGIITQCPRDVVIGNTVYNNGADTGLAASNRRGIYMQNGGSAAFNVVYNNDQGAGSQSYGISGASRTNGNISTGNDGADYFGLAAGSHVGNIDSTGMSPDKKMFLIKVLAGTSNTIIDPVVTGMTTNDQKSAMVCQVGSGSATTSPMAPATTAWIGRSGGILRLRTDAVVTADVEFLVIVDNTVQRIAQP